MRRIATFGLIAGMGFTAWSKTEAAEPTAKMNPLMAMFKRIDADPNKDYRVTDKNGPWMIMAHVFRGEKATEQARALVYELRKGYKLEAYTHEVVFDYSQSWDGQHIDKYGQREKMRNEHAEKVKEVAVLVGNYASVEDKDAIATLKQIKSKEMQPKCMEQIANAGSNNSSASSIDSIQQSVAAAKKKGPMMMAFISTNPVLPEEYFKHPSLDKFVLEMNSEGEYNMLNCPGKISVRVATFSGSSIIDQKKIKELEKPGSKKTLQGKLQDAADKAELLCHSLREKGYQAWVFHDRHESMVSIGSFNEVGVKRADGKIEIDPEIHKIMKLFGPDQKSNSTNAQANIPEPKFTNVSYEKQVMKIVLDLQPIPIQVPKRGVGAAYQR